MTRSPTACLCGVLAVLSFVVLAAVPARADAGANPAAQPQVKNVIVLIADGCGAEQYTLARWFRGEPLTLDEIRVGAVKTYIADSVVADSAPAATAFATGVRSSAKFISVGPRKKTISVVPTPPEDLCYRPLATVLEGAKLLGRATGIVSTSRSTHATPAAYVSHAASRNDESEIMEQLVHQNVDVVFGGGRDYLFPKSAGGKRADSKDLSTVLQSRGYRLVRTGKELAELRAGRVFGLFAAGHMAPEIDRPATAPDEPTLETMAAKAIELLSQNPRGFFLMIEGSQVDFACHANDPSQLMSDLLMYDRAVKVALDFARRDGNTLILAMSDHNTGGMSIGSTASNGMYTKMTVEDLVGPLKNMKRSAPELAKQVGKKPTPEQVKSVVAEYWGMKITGQEAEKIAAMLVKQPDNPQNAFCDVLGPTHTLIGWTTHGHTGGDVPLFAFGPGRPVGLIEGPDVARITAAALGLDLARLNRRLFVDASEALPDAKLTVEQAGPAEPKVKIDFQGRTAELPVNGNVLVVDGKSEQLEGVVIHAAETGKTYLPLQAIQRIRGLAAELPSVASEAR